MMKYTLLAAVSLLAFQAQAETLKEMKIQGTRRIENATVANYTGMKVGKEVTDADLDAATKTLFATGLFSDVDVKMKDGVVSVQVQENPRMAANGGQRGRVGEHLYRPETGNQCLAECGRCNYLGKRTHRTDKHCLTGPKNTTATVTLLRIQRVGYIPPNLHNCVTRLCS